MILITQYDFSQLITQKDIDIAIETINFFFEKDGWVEQNPSFQTWPYLFEHENFYKLKLSFIFSCFSYLGKEVNIKNINCWCYMDFYDNWKLKNPEELWHSHKKIGERKLSGIFYLNVPQGNDLPSTEFVDQDDILLEKFSWFIYPSDLIHRPGKITSNERRYVIAADLTYD